jgi:hypothetical protein
MDAEEIKEEILHQRELQKEFRKRLRVLEKQAAKFGDAYVPPHIQTEIDELNVKIQDCDKKIIELKAKIVEPHEHELEAFEAMLQVLSDASATTWIFMGFTHQLNALYRLDIPLGDIDEHEMRDLSINMTRVCLRHKQRLQEVIADAENM